MPARSRRCPRDRMLARWPGKAKRSAGPSTPPPHDVKSREHQLPSRPRQPDPPSRPRSMARLAFRGFGERLAIRLRRARTADRAPGWRGSRRVPVLVARPYPARDHLFLQRRQHRHPLGRSSLRWWVGDPTAQESIVYDPALRAALLHSLLLASWTTLIAVPFGCLRAWVPGWRSRVPRLGLWVMLLAVASPPIVLGVAMWLLFAFPFGISRSGRSGGSARERRSSVWSRCSFRWPHSSCSPPLLISPEQEEMAADLGASPGEVVRRVLLPQLGPAISHHRGRVRWGDEGVRHRVRFGVERTRALGPLCSGRWEARHRVQRHRHDVAIVGAASFALLAVAFRTAFDRRSTFQRRIE